MIAPINSSDLDSGLKSTSSVVNKGKWFFSNGKKTNKSNLPSLKNELYQLYAKKDKTVNKESEGKSQKPKHQTLSPLPKSFIVSRFYNIQPKLLHDHKQFKSGCKTGMGIYGASSAVSSQNSLKNSPNFSLSYSRGFSEYKEGRTSFYNKIKESYPLKTRFRRNIK